MSDNIPKIGKISKYCKYPACENKYYSKISDPQYVNKKFHIFPRNPELFELWKNICHIKPNDSMKSLFICEDHFDDSDFNNPQTKISLRQNV